MRGILDSNQIDNLLNDNIIGRLGCTDGGKVYIAPVAYVFNGDYILIESRDGIRMSMMQKNPNVCLEVDEMESLDCWRSVMLWGEYEEITDESEGYYAIRFFTSRMKHLRLSETALLGKAKPDALCHHRYVPWTEHPIIYRIRIKERIGRYEME